MLGCAVGVHGCGLLGLVLGFAVLGGAVVPYVVVVPGCYYSANGFLQ